MKSFSDYVSNVQESMFSMDNKLDGKYLAKTKNLLKKFFMLYNIKSNIENLTYAYNMSLDNSLKQINKELQNVRDELENYFGDHDVVNILSKIQDIVPLKDYKDLAKDAEKFSEQGYKVLVNGGYIR